MKRENVIFYWLLAIGAVVLAVAHAPPVSAEPCVCYEPRAEMAGVAYHDCGVVCNVVFGDEVCNYHVQDYVLSQEFVGGYKVNNSQLIEITIEEICYLDEDNCRFGPPCPAEHAFEYHFYYYPCNIPWAP